MLQATDPTLFDTLVRQIKIWVGAEFAMGVLKIVLGVLLQTALYPTCPDGCICDIQIQSFYPFLAIGLGCFWIIISVFLFRRVQYIQQARHARAPDAPYHEIDHSNLEAGKLTIPPPPPPPPTYTEPPAYTSNTTVT
eukprot:TRINITY_DN11630_c0_g1_i1.p1 TRINITY_DN11630_c0_g1~~TRINITY_DN11630_c0_g1_i1.p1  ORF type:complete len:137 (-),score=23.96 TRINITY_DN11630_c0_g1_i1:312-722(-)